MSIPNNTDPYFFNEINPDKGITKGLVEFMNSVDRDFFSETKLLFKHSQESKKTELILDICCNFGLTVGLHHFNSGSWGGFNSADNGSKPVLSFLETFNRLNQCNDNTLELSEISLNFLDTSIIITQLYDQSIPEQLEQIITKVSEHFVYFTKGLTEMPYEIFVPVFEDTLPDIPGLEKEQNNYFSYWGLYFEEGIKHRVMVYDLENKQFCNEDLFLLE
ncbi:hypothetical protein GTQ34_02295 [Muricauda sp. JGD-17]|uniref:Uncharacterized protein n=1 Tax=Flagellimonas ochracea TaxID=2696472 RepID=A0A964TB08_9FLAO|nr:hypothetical protein [Allomuricauda ochracea]NAY90738.1 hypothetical protein [Allomuricauda ochracea]